MCSRFLHTTKRINRTGLHQEEKIHDWNAGMLDVPFSIALLDDFYFLLGNDTSREHSIGSWN